MHTALICGALFRRETVNDMRPITSKFHNIGSQEAGLLVEICHKSDFHLNCVVALFYLANESSRRFDWLRRLNLRAHILSQSMLYWLIIWIVVKSVFVMCTIKTQFAHS